MKLNARNVKVTMIYLT